VKWRLIVKGVAPPQGTYHDWKALLAVEAEHQCVYCTIHEAGFGGYRNFHVEHFRPKRRFPNLENDYANLFYACAVCNSLKGDDWPCGKRLGMSLFCYPDPSRTNYQDMFLVNWAKGRVRGRTRAGRFVVERLYLNRPQLMMERRAFALQRSILREAAGIRRLAIRLTTRDAAMVSSAIQLLERGMQLMAKYSRVRPYEPADVNL
jgi:hypothetical protein